MNWLKLSLTYLGLAAIFMHDWDGFVFEQTVRDFWNGQTPYAVAQSKPWYSFIGVTDHEPQWYAYPPLPLLAMALSFAPVLALEAIGIDVPEFIQRIGWKLPMILATILLARVGRQWANYMDKPETADRVEAMLAWSPFLILVGPVWGMTDAALMAFFLLALLRFEQDRPWESGAWFAASLLVKPFPVLFAIPVLALALGQGKRHLIPRFLGSTAAVGLAFVLPFLIVDAHGFYEQVIGAHLGRASQGLNTWTLWPLNALSLHTVKIASMSLIAASIGWLSILAAKMKGTDRMLRIAFLAAAMFLLWNRVLNEQYLVMLAAPALILTATGTMTSRWPLRATYLYAAAIVLSGFHFLTFIPPDIALPLFGRPVDAVAEQLRQMAPTFWSILRMAIHFLIPASLILQAVVSTQFLEKIKEIPWRRATPSLGICLLLVATTLATSADDTETPAFSPAFDENKISTFYYLWWHNPAHAPEHRYGNWLPVSQDPEIGFYTNNRGTSRDHAYDMVNHGIDTAIISYHRGELVQYEVFQEEALKAGLWVTPLIELNQVYDMVIDGERPHRPINQDNVSAPYAAYRTSDAAQNEIEAFVLDLRDQISMENQMKIDGKPVIMFYDAYVSGVSFHEEDQIALTEALVDLFGYELLREKLADPTIDSFEDVFSHHPSNYTEFFIDPSSGPWREAHLHVHEQFWNTLRERLEAELGPLFLIAGDAYNERAGFEAGTVKSLLNLEVFDGSFIYSPSFAWGSGPEKPYLENFALWEDRNYWMQSAALGSGKYSVVGLAPAYDDTVNRPERGFVIPPTHDGQSTYTRSWESVLAQSPNMVAISTYNEYFEGSSIEASTQFGNEWLLQTPGFRQQFLGPADPQWLIVHHERASRTSIAHSETDSPHEWGLSLTAAANRIQTGVASLDAQSESIPWTPTRLLIDGGRDTYQTGPAWNQVLSWSETIPTVFFGAGGPSVESCVQSPEFSLRPGDFLRGDNGQLHLVRDGTTTEVGGVCDGIAFVHIKFASTQETDAVCLKAILDVMLDEAQASCTVASTRNV